MTDRMTDRETRAGTARPRLVERYRAFLPVTDATPPLTLGEGFTPLVRAGRLGDALGLANLYLKVEGQNPTGSFKDRGMVVAVAKASEAGARAIVCASTGNTSASAAAYGAAAGLEVIVVLPKGQIATGKLLQALIAGARVVAIDGNFDQALGIVRALAEQDDHPVTLVNSVNPFRLEGQKTAAFEICDDLGRAPDVLAIPVGNAGNISAYWAGLPRIPGRRPGERPAPDVGLPGRRRGPDRRRPPDRAAGDGRDRHPDRRSGVVGAGGRCPGRLGRPDHGRDRRRDPVGIPRPGALRGHLLRTGLGGQRGRRDQGRGGRRARPGRDRGVRADRPWPQGSWHCRAPGPPIPGGCADHRLGRRGARLVGERTMDARWLAELDGSRITVEVPATSANLGAGYDCLGLALAITNTIELEIRVWSRGEIDLTIDGEGRGRADRGPRQPLRARPRDDAVVPPAAT